MSVSFAENRCVIANSVDPDEMPHYATFYLSPLFAKERI